MSIFAFAFKGLSGGDKEENSNNTTNNKSTGANKIGARALSSEEVAKLKEENAELRDAISKMQQQMKKAAPLPPHSAAWARTGVKGTHLNASPTPPLTHSPSAPPAEAPSYPSLNPSAPTLDSLTPSAPSFYPSLLDDDTAPSAPSDVSLIKDEQVQELQGFYQQLRVALSSEGQTPATASSSTPSTASAYPSMDITAEGHQTNTDADFTSDLADSMSALNSEAALKHLGVLNNKPVCCPSKTAVLVSSLEYDEENEEDSEQVAVVDLENVEWWTLVKNENESDTFDDSPKEKKEVEVEGETELCTLDDDGADGYVLVKENDALDALAEFIVKQMAKHREVRQLTPQQVRAMIEGTMCDMQEPTTVKKVWNWGRLAYQAWGWGSTAWALYKEPAMIRLVASGAIKAATWILVLVA